MRDELAGQLLDLLLDWSDEQRATWMRDLQRMAAYKYDGYEGFAPAERFFERLARWLQQVEDPADRLRFLQFVREELIYISREEMDHVIASVYPDIIKSDLVREVARTLDRPWWQAGAVASTREFRTLRRKTLYLGMSDGARLDRLRRSSPELSHEQFWLAPELSEASSQRMVKKLQEALDKQDLPGSPKFERVVLVDDFYGSGTSLIRRSEDGDTFEGKLVRTSEHLRSLEQDGVVVTDPHVTVVIYLASHQAATHITETVSEFNPAWDTRVAYVLPAAIVEHDEELIRLCEWFYDDVLNDEHKGRAALGYKDAALPLVIFHNTPNNSISPLWADTAEHATGQARHALFPRYERHHVERP